MSDWGPHPRQGDTGGNPPPGLSVLGSTFGDYARVSHQSFQLQNGTFLNQFLDQFLSQLSGIDPRKEIKSIDALEYVRSTNGDVLQEHLDPGSDIDTWLGEGSEQFIFVNDPTETVHFILASKIIHKVETACPNEYFATSYFFPKRQDNRERISCTASDIVAGLARVCLTDSRFGHRLISEIQQTYGSLEITSNFGVSAGILMDILSWLHRESNGQRILFVVDGIQNCVINLRQNGLCELIAFMKKLAKTFPWSKWVISGRLMDEVEMHIRDLCHLAPSVNLILAHAVGVFNLDDTIKAIMALAQEINATPTHQKLKQHRTVQEDVSWFRYCNAARKWFVESNGKPRILGYRRSFQQPLEPSSLACHLAMQGFEDAMSSRPLPVYFSFSEVFSIDHQRPPTIPFDGFHPAQAVWCLFSQLATLYCNDYASLATTILTFSEYAQDDLKFIDKFIVANKGSGAREPSPGEASIVSWFRPLMSLNLDRMKDFTKALVKKLKSDGIRVLLIVDCLELVNPGHGAEFLTFLRDLDCDLWALLCFNDEDGRDYKSWNGWTQHLCDETVIHEKTEYQECKDSLCFKDMHQRREQISDPLHESNQWLWSNETFYKWEQVGGLLWISGKAGSGKSVLAKSIQRRFSSQAGEASVEIPWLTCGWFYTARSSDAGQRHDFMMRSILYEMLESATPVFDDVKPLYRDFVSSTDGAVEWTSDKLEIMLDGVRASSAIPATVAVIDALDESENISGAQVDWEKALKILQRLVKNSNIRLVVLSRPESHIRDILKGSAVINLEQHNRGDISILIEDGICRLRKAWPLSPDQDFPDEDEICSAGIVVPDVVNVSSSNIGPVARTRVTQMRVEDTEREQREQMLDKIRQHLKREASGVILWVTVVLYRLQIDIQGKSGFTPRQLRVTLESLPTEIEELYSYSLEKLGVFEDPSKLSVAKDILTWIVGSKGWAPLELRELRDALAISEIGLNQQEQHSLKDSRRHVGGNWSKFCLYIQDHCGPLVEILDNHQSPLPVQHNRKERHRSHVAQPTWTIQLLHQTVNSFLRNNSRRWPLQVERNEAEHYVITKSYLYLGIPTSSKTVFNPPHTNPQAEPLDVLEKLMPATPFQSEIQHELLAMRQCCKEWPLARFALVVLWQTQPTEVTIPERLSRIDHDSVSLTEERLHFPLYWATDMCFIPPYSQESNIKSLIKHCCLTGNVDALRLLFKLMQSYKHRYESLHSRRYLISGHDRQMIQGAIQAINYLEDQGTLCHYEVKWALHELKKRLLKQESVETASNQKISGQCCLSDTNACSNRSISSERSTSPDKTIPRKKRNRKKRKLGASQFKTTSLQLNKSKVAQSQQTIQIYGKSTSCQKITDAVRFILKSLSIDVGFRPFLDSSTHNEYIAMLLSWDAVYVPGYDMQRAQARRYDQQKRMKGFDNVYHRPSYLKDETEANADDDLSLE